MVHYIRIGARTKFRRLRAASHADRVALILAMTSPLAFGDAATLTIESAA